MEVLHVIGIGGDILAELVQNRIHQIIRADEIYRRIFGPEHPEACLKVLLEIKVCREGKSILPQDIRTLQDPVQAEGPDPLTVEYTDHVIEIAVPDQLMGDEDPRFPIAQQLRLLPDIVLEVQEGDLLSGIDSLVDAVNDQVNALVVVASAFVTLLS